MEKTSCIDCGKPANKHLIDRKPNGELTVLEFRDTRPKEYVVLCTNPLCNSIYVEVTV